MNLGVIMRMKPAKATNSTPLATNKLCSAHSNASQLSKVVSSKTVVVIPCALAQIRPRASGRLEITCTILAGKLLSCAALTKDIMLEPRPDIKTETGTRVCSVVLFIVIMSQSL